MAPCPAQPGKVAVVRAGQSWLHPCILAGDSLKGSGVTVTFGSIDLGPSWGSAELLPLPGHQVPARPRQQQPLCHLPELSKALWLHWENGNAWILRAWGPGLCPCCLSTFQPLLPMCSCDIAVPNPLLSCSVPHLSAHGDLWDICSLPWTPQPLQGSLCPAKSGAADDATRLPALEPGPGTRGGLSELRELPQDGAFPPSAKPHSSGMALGCPWSCCWSHRAGLVQRHVVRALLALPPLLSPPGHLLLRPRCWVSSAAGFGAGGHRVSPNRGCCWQDGMEGGRTEAERGTG